MSSRQFDLWLWEQINGLQTHSSQEFFVNVFDYLTNPSATSFIGKNVNQEHMFEQLHACSVNTLNNPNQSGYELLNLENWSSVNSDNFDATDLKSVG